MSENPAKILRAIFEAIVPARLRADDYQARFAEAEAYCDEPITAEQAADETAAPDRKAKS